MHVYAYFEHEKSQHIYGALSWWCVLF